MYGCWMVCDDYVSGVGLGDVIQQDLVCGLWLLYGVYVVFLFLYIIGVVCCCDRYCSSFVIIYMMMNDNVMKNIVSGVSM